MADGKYIEIGTTGKKEEAQAINSTAGVADASKIIRTNAAGIIDPSFMPGAERKVIAASEALAAGDFVNIWDDAGTPKVRKADASAASASKQADGFVLEAVLITADAIVYFEGINTELSGLTGGTIYNLGTAGAAVATVNTTSGNIHQPLGKAISATELQFERAEPVIRV